MFAAHLMKRKAPFELLLIVSLQTLSWYIVDDAFKDLELSQNRH